MAALAVTWFVLILRVQPWPFSDYAVFLTVARRLSAGDRLYEEIWDNKDPFVYYSLALLQDLGQPALWTLEVLWFVLASASVFAIARFYTLARNWAVFIGGVLTPIALIPFHYFPGTTHLPGTSLVLLSVALSLHRRYAWSGVVIGLLFFFKLSMLPLALIAIGVVLTSRRSARPAVPIGIAATGILVAAGPLLTLRGELLPYLRSLLHNFTYSQTNTGSGETGLAATMVERFTVLSDLHVLVTIVTIALVLLFSWKRSGRNEIWTLTAATFATAVILTLAIGKFPHHAQVFGASGALALVTFVLALGTFRSRAVISAGIALLVAIGLAGGPSLQGYRNALLNPQGTWSAMTTTDSATEDLLTSGPARSFAILQGAGLPRSPGLEEWELVCRHIAQRPWESEDLLTESLECFPNAEVLLVPLELGIPETPRPFNRFLLAVRDLLESDYRCSPGTQNLVCERVAPAS